MTRFGVLAACAVVLAAGSARAAQDHEPAAATSWPEAVTGGAAGVALRYRLEFVDQDGIAEAAEASTLRFRFHYETADWRELRAFVEFDHVAEVILDNFDNGVSANPERGQYPLVVDPHGTDLNQAYVDFRGFDDALLRVGRQRILLDNQRFVGGVGWRQNEQTYDAITARYGGIAGVELEYSFVTAVKRILGDRSPAGRHDGRTHLLHAAVRLPDDWKLTPYAYLIDNDDMPAFSTATFGARLTGGIPVGQRRLALAAELATQADYANAPADYRAGYWRVDARLPFTDTLGVGAGYEVLGADSPGPGDAFRTPLATLHAFQGWADRFLATPAGGIEDRFLSAGWAPGRWSLSAIWHDFRVAEGSGDYGSELDLSATRPFGERYSLQAKAAFFDGAEAAPGDTTKIWLVLAATF